MNFIHIISSKGIKPDPSKVAVIKNYKEPTTLKELRSFLGLSSYYRKFINNFAKIASPLTDLTKGFTVSKSQKISIVDRWKVSQQASFDQLKQIICEDVTLAFPNFNLPFKLSTDASDFAIGGILSQHDPSTGEDRPITFFSRRLNDAE